MVPWTRRDTLTALPTLAVGLSGCSGLSDEQYSLPVQTAWTADLMQPAVGVHSPADMILVGSRSPFDSDPIVSGLDPVSGDTEWAAPGTSEPSSPVAVDADHAYVFSKTGAVFAFDHRTGNRIWEASIPRVTQADPGVVQFAPLVVDDIVVIPVSGTEGDVVDRLVGFTRSDGAKTFSVELPASISGAPASDERSVVVPLLDGTLCRVDTDGTELWTVDLGGALSDVAIANETVYVGCATESVVAIDLETGQRQWSSGIDNTVFARPLVADGRVFVGGVDYYLSAFDAASGKLLWRTETPNAITTGPTIVEEKLITLSGGGRRLRGRSGSVPYAPTVLSVHDLDGTRINDYRFEGYRDGGQPNWAVGIDDGIYVGQEWQIARIGMEVLDV